MATGMPWVVSNTDPSIPTARGIAPGNGALVQAVRMATGADPLVAGKPSPAMHRECVLRSGARRPLVVGDRLDTDIAGARAAGVDSLLVLTGVTTARDLLEEPPDARPTYVAHDLRGLLVPHPPVRTDPAGGVRCGAVRVRRHGAAVECRGAEDGTALDALRALCAVVWEDGAGLPPLGDVPALARFGL